MKRSALAMLLAAALGGCISVDHGPTMSGPACPGSYGAGGGPPMIPGVQGPWGQGVPVSAPYPPPVSAKQAHYMMSHSVPLDMVQAPGMKPGGSGIMQASANVPQGGMPGMAMPPGGLIGP